MGIFITFLTTLINFLELERNFLILKYYYYYTNDKNKNCTVYNLSNKFHKILKLVSVIYDKINHSSLLIYITQNFTISYFSLLNLECKHKISLQYNFLKYIMNNKIHI